MLGDFPQSVLFCCDHNAVRSPMAEGLMKQMYGQRAYVQSAGVRNDMEIDGFSVAVCKELGIELSRHRSRSFDEMQEWGDDLSPVRPDRRPLPRQPAHGAGTDPLSSSGDRILADPRPHRPGRDAGRQARRLPPGAGPDQDADAGAVRAADGGVGDVGTLPHAPHVSLYSELTYPPPGCVLFHLRISLAIMGER